MKRKLMDLLACPYCSDRLDLEEFGADPADAAEIHEGVLSCGACGRGFPIINAIPRMLPDHLLPALGSYHPEFFRRFGARFPANCRESIVVAEDSGWRARRGTLASYSYQWRKFNEMLPHWRQVFLDSIRPIEPAFFRGRLGLDAGCGFGRSLYYAASYGAEMIGMDLSEAVEAARGNTRHLPNVHLIQADIFHPPIRDRSLD